MPDKPIINARRQIGWQRRWLSDAATLALWIGWVYLWIPLVVKFHQIFIHHKNIEIAAIEMLETVAPIPVVTSVAILLGTSALLMLWTLLPKRSVIHAHEAVPVEEYARHFGLDAQAVQTGRASRICVVVHDEAGNFVEIQPRQSQPSSLQSHAFFEIPPRP